MSTQRIEWEKMVVNESFAIGYNASGLVRSANQRLAPKKWVCRKGPKVNYVVVRVK